MTNVRGVLPIVWEEAGSCGYTYLLPRGTSSIQVFLPRNASDCLHRHMEVIVNGRHWFSRHSGWYHWIAGPIRHSWQLGTFFLFLLSIEQTYFPNAWSSWLTVSTKIFPTFRKAAISESVWLEATKTRTTDFFYYSGVGAEATTQLVRIETRLWSKVGHSGFRQCVLKCIACTLVYANIKTDVYLSEKHKIIGSMYVYMHVCVYTQT